MAKLVLKFENTTLKQFPLSQGGVTIGRLPDNDIVIDNPAVSGHHARVFWESNHFTLEDTKSFNGTYINDQRITRQPLNDNDTILVGKHTLSFSAEPSEYVAPAANVAPRIAVPTLEATAMLDTKKARELLAQAAAAKPTPAAAPVPVVTGQMASFSAPAPAPKLRLGVLTVVSGKTDQSSYVLTGKLTVVGKSNMASIQLKGWFAPQVAAAINRHGDKYFIAPATKNKVRVNGGLIPSQWELNPGDMISVGKVTMTFNYNE